MEIFSVFGSSEKAQQAKEWVNWIHRNTEITNYCSVFSADRNTPICTFGGDKTLLDAIQQYWKYQKVFIGFNFGTKGFLLNPVESREDLLSVLRNYDHWTVLKLGLLKVVFYDQEGRSEEFYAFNDVYFNAKPRTMVYGRIWADSFPELPFEGDGIIIATPQGSTAYCYNAGGTILSLDKDTPDRVAITTNNSRSRAIRTSIRAKKIVVEFDRGFPVGSADTTGMENVKKAVIEPASAKVKLAFRPDYDFEAARFLKANQH